MGHLTLFLAWTGRCPGIARARTVAAAGRRASAIGHIETERRDHVNCYIAKLYSILENQRFTTLRQLTCRIGSLRLRRNNILARLYEKIKQAKNDTYKKSTISCPHNPRLIEPWLRVDLELPGTASAKEQSRRAGWSGLS
jgi:hypothetical protein